MRRALATAAVLVLLATPALAATQPKYWHYPNAPEQAAEGSVRVVVTYSDGTAWHVIDGAIVEPATGYDVCGPRTELEGAG